ncbi:MAG: hypothetical protein ACW99G_18030 [Candidatus Thorarchaeota archaeon]|jgi:hypothetical protein
MKTEVFMTQKKYVEKLRKKIRMTAIRETGKVNENTTLIDFGMSGAAGSGAVYLVEAG